MAAQNPMSKYFDELWPAVTDEDSISYRALRGFGVLVFDQLADYWLKSDDPLPRRLLALKLLSENPKASCIVLERCYATAAYTAEVLERIALACTIIGKENYEGTFVGQILAECFNENTLSAVFAFCARINAPGVNAEQSAESLSCRGYSGDIVRLIQRAAASRPPLTVDTQWLQ